MRKWLGASLITLTLLYIICLGCLYAQHLLFYRRVIFEVPIRFEEGFSFKRRFTVDAPVTYWVGIQYDEVFRSTPELQLPRDEFAAEFEVTSQNKSVVKGSTASIPAWSGPWANTGNRLIRYLGSFNARPGEMYELSLRITGASPRLLSKAPKALVEIDWSFDQSRPLRESLLLWIGLLIAILMFAYAWSVLHSHRKKGRMAPRAPISPTSER